MIKSAKQKSHSLARQFFIVVASVIFSAMGITVYLQYNSESNLIEKSLLQRGHSLTQLLASISIDPLLIYDDVTLNEYAKYASQQKGVVYATVVDNAQQPMTHFLDQDNAYIQNALQAFDMSDLGAILKQLRNSPEIISFTLPVTFDNKTLAYIWLGLDRKPYLESLNKTLYKILFATIFIGLFIGGMLSILFERRIWKPIASLKESAQHIAALDFGRPIKVNSRDEFSTLADAFDDMRTRLKETIESHNKSVQEVSVLNDTLEERVHNRTLELQELNTQIAHQAMHDPLTGLPNRVLVTERIQQSIYYAKRHDKTLAVFMLDLNNFKEVNDTLGHPEGDRLLKDVASRLPQALRQSDTVGRLGGDEFAMVLPGVTEAEAVEVAEKILQHLLPSFEIDLHHIKIGASIGIAMYPDHGDEQSVLIRLADVAMYEAKSTSTGVCVYAPELDKYTPARLALMADLHVAIEDDQLELHYQPKVCLDTGKVHAVEALIRWQHPKLGWVFPDQFIPMAENSGLINSLSDWVLDQAFQQWRIWQDTSLNLQIAINLSARNLLDSKLPDRIGQLCEQYNMTGFGIKAEITESAIMSNPEQVMEIMDDPQMKRLHFSIDDFGTGYSSLGYLKKLSVHEVKIDRSFVVDMAQDKDDAMIVKSVIDLAHNLGHTVVAEGVEDGDTLSRLVSLGCDDVQGYFFSKPIPAADLPAAIKRIEDNLKASNNPSKVGLQ